MSLARGLEPICRISHKQAPTRELSEMYVCQNFEDAMLNRLFHEQATGLYIDVGAREPNMHSVTKHFYKDGWRCKYRAAPLEVRVI